MIRKTISLILVIAFLNYMFVGCIQTSEYKLLKEEFNERLYSERIIKVVLKTGTVYEFSPAARYEGSQNMISGYSDDGIKLSFKFIQYNLKEIRVSKPESIPIESVNGIPITEIVFKDNLLRKSVDGIWFYDAGKNLLYAKQDDEIVYQSSADSIKEVRISAQKLITKEELKEKPDTMVHEIVFGKKLYTFNKKGGYLVEGNSAFVGNTIQGEQISIPESEVLYVKVETVDAGKTFFATLGGFVLILGVIALIALATKQSCPFIYSYTGDKYIFDAEPLGGAVTKGLQKTDYSRLEHLVPVDGKYQLLFRNEVRETQYLDAIKLHVFDHEKNATIIPDFYGKFRKIFQPMVAKSVINEDGQDLSLFLNKNDGIAWQTALPHDDKKEFNTNRHHITLTYPKPEGATHANLIFNGGTALWGSNMIRKMLELRGDSLDSWYNGINTHGPEYAELLHFTVREELYVLKIHVRNNDQWIQAGYLSGGGPLITEDRIVPINLSGVEGDSLVIRIDPPPGFWQIDYMAVDYNALPVESNFQIPLEIATDNNDTNMTDLLAFTDDNYYEMPMVGDWFRSEFIAPDAHPSLSRSIFIEITGYYELHIDKTKPEETALLKKLVSTPGEIVNYSMERYYEWYNQQVSFKIAFTVWLILFVSQSVLFSQVSDSTQAINKLVHRDYRYNSIIITMLDGSKESGLIADVNSDSLIILKKGLREAISASKIQKVTFYGPVNTSGTIWAGFFTAMYLGNILFYQSDMGVYSYTNNQQQEEPFALATRDYPEGIGAIGINALFGFVGMSLTYFFSQSETEIGFSFTEDINEQQNEWNNFRNYLIGVRTAKSKSVHVCINMGSLSHRVLDSYTAAGTQMYYVQRYSSYLNFVRKMQISVDVYKKIRLGAVVSFQGEPSVSGHFRNEDNRDGDISLRYDARGYYGIISYPVISRDISDKFELIVGVGIGQIKPSLEFEYSIYQYPDHRTRKIEYNTPDISAILLAELHYYITDHYSLLFAVDYCNSPEITVKGNDVFEIPERKISFGNSSFGFGIGFHF